MSCKVYACLNFSNFSDTRKDAAELDSEFYRIRPTKRVGVDEVQQTELGEPTSNMAIIERHNQFKAMVQLSLGKPDGSNPRRCERPQAITVTELRQDVISVDKAVIDI